MKPLTKAPRYHEDARRLVSKYGVRGAARKIGIPKSTLHDIVSGKTKKAKPKTTRKISQAAKTNLHWRADVYHRKTRIVLDDDFDANEQKINRLYNRLPKWTAPASAPSAHPGRSPIPTLKTLYIIRFKVVPKDRKAKDCEVYSRQNHDYYDMIDDMYGFATTICRVSNGEGQIIIVGITVKKKWRQN